ncbi:MAG: hypothetical protein ABIB97_03250 [Patescibacteria group bacterium]
MTSKLKKNSKVIIIVTVVIVVLVGGAIYLLSRKTETAEEIVNSVAIVNETINTNDNLNNQSVNLNTNQALNQNTNQAVSASSQYPANDWAVYNDVNYDYSLMYPADWTDERAAVASAVEINSNVLNTNSDVYFEQYFMDQGEKYGEFIIVEGSNWTPSLKGNWSSQESEMEVGGIAATKTIYTPTDLEEWDTNPGTKTKIVFTEPLPIDKTIEIGLENKNNSQITADVLAGILSSFQFDYRFPAVSSFWIRTLGDVETGSSLGTFDLTTGEIIESRVYPTQTMFSFNIIPNPEAGKVAYYQYNSEEESYDIILSDTKGLEDKIIANGVVCVDGPCDFENAVALGELSKDGNYFSYFDHNEVKVQNLITDEVTVLPDSYSTSTSFSPMGNYIFSRWQREYDSAIQYSKISDISTTKIEGTEWNTAFSFNEKYLASSKQQYDSETEGHSVDIYLYNVLTGDLVDQMTIADYSQTGTTNLAWLTNDRFVVLAEKDNSTKEAFLIEIINNKMVRRSLSTSTGEKVKGERIFRIDSDSVLLDYMVDNKYSIYSYDINGDKEIIFEDVTDGEKWYSYKYYLLGPND